jgi:hypothetical protein
MRLINTLYRGDILMKKRIVSALVLAGMIASTSAFASNARELVMGTGGADSFSNGGSFYYEDAYNFFYNPAYVNDYKNWAIFEKGTNDTASFGFVSSMMNFNLGLFFNRNAALNSFNGHQIGANATDLMIGGDAGVKWGVGLTYGSSGNSNDRSSNLDIRAGVSVSGFDPFLSVKAIGSDKVGGTKTASYTDNKLGLRYHYGEWTPYAAYRMQQNKTEATGAKSKDNSFVVGLGRETKLAEGARLVYSIYYVNSKVSTDPATTDTKLSLLPIDMAIEADALSWLTLRGGVHHVLASASGTNETTTARIGGTFHVAKVDVDYAFGTSANGAGGASNATTADSQDIGFDSGTFHEIAMRYSW